MLSGVIARFTALSSFTLSCLAVAWLLSALMPWDPSASRKLPVAPRRPPRRRPDGATKRPRP